jgi:hypothetical protein
MTSKNAVARQFRLFGSVAGLGLLALGLSTTSLGCAEGTGINYDSVASDYAPPSHAAPPPEKERTDPNATDSTTPTAPFLAYPPGAVATLGSTFVDANHTSILIYPAHPTSESSPGAILDAPTAPGGIASMVFDTKRQLYTLDYSGRVNVFASGAAGTATPVRVINPNGLYTDADASYASGIAIDSKGEVTISINTNLDHEGPESILTYASDAEGDAVPARTISGANTKLRLPIDLAFDAEDNLFVGDYMAYSVFVFSKDADGDVAPLRTACVTEGLQAMAVSPNGTVYVAPEGVPGWSVRVYEPFNGSFQKLAGVIQGPSTGLDTADEWPQALALDPWGELVVIGPQSGLRFESGQLGDVAPLSTFTGWNAIAVAPRGDGLAISD